MGLLNKKNIKNVESNKYVGIKGLKMKDLETGDLAVLEDQLTKDGDIDFIGVIILKKDITDFTDFCIRFCNVPIDETDIGYIMFPGKDLKDQLWSYIRLKDYRDDLKYNGWWHYSITSVIKHAVNKKDVLNTQKCIDIIEKYRKV